MKLKFLIACIFIVVIGSLACKKKSVNPIKDEPLVYTAIPAPIVHGGWRKMGAFFNHNCNISYLFVIGNVSYFFVTPANNQMYTSSKLTGNFFKYDPGTNTFSVLKTPAFSNAFFTFAFAVSGKGYIGSYSTVLGVWEYDPASDSWTPKTPFPNNDVVKTPTFTIADKGYMCGLYRHHRPL